MFRDLVILIIFSYISHVDVCGCDSFIWWHFPLNTLVECREWSSWDFVAFIGPSGFSNDLKFCDRPAHNSEQLVFIINVVWRKHRIFITFWTIHSLSSLHTNRDRWSVVNVELLCVFRELNRMKWIKSTNTWSQQKRKREANLWINLNSKKPQRYAPSISTAHQMRRDEIKYCLMFLTGFSISSHRSQISPVESSVFSFSPRSLNASHPSSVNSSFCRESARYTHTPVSHTPVSHTFTERRFVSL